MTDRPYKISAEWSSRQESARACAQRLARTLTGLAAISPIFAQWNKKGESRETANDPFCTMPPDIGELTDIVQCAETVRDATGEPWPELGYHLGTWNGVDDPFDAGLTLAVGEYADSRRFSNVVTLSPPDLCPETKQLYDLDRMTDLAMILARAWTPDFVQVEPFLLSVRVYPGPEKLMPVRAGWITYLKPDFARLVTPPPSVLSRMTADGGLLMMTGTDPLDPDDPKQIKTLLEVQKALEPLNREP